MVSLSPDGIIRTWNAAAEQLFGYQASEVIGKSVRMFSPERCPQTSPSINAERPFRRRRCTATCSAGTRTAI